MDSMLLGIHLFSTIILLFGIFCALLCLFISTSWLIRLASSSAVAGVSWGLFSGLRIAGSYLPLDPDCSGGSITSSALSCAARDLWERIVAERPDNLEILVASLVVTLMAGAVLFWSYRASKAKLDRHELASAGVRKV